MEYLQLETDHYIRGILRQAGIKGYDYTSDIEITDTSVYPDGFEDVYHEYQYIDGGFIHNPKEEAELPDVLNDLYLNYLNETDWYVTRKFETGKAIPQEVLIKRQEARAAIQNDFPK